MGKGRGAGSAKNYRRVRRDVDFRREQTENNHGRSVADASARVFERINCPGSREGYHRERGGEGRTRRENLARASKVHTTRAASRIVSPGRESDAKERRPRGPASARPVIRYRKRNRVRERERKEGRIGPTDG